MGAAAVFETAAETPPTRQQLVSIQYVSIDDSPKLNRLVELYRSIVGGISMERTQEVNDETL